MFPGPDEIDAYVSSFFDPTYKGLCVKVGALDQGGSGSNPSSVEPTGWESVSIAISDPVQTLNHLLQEQQRPRKIDVISIATTTTTENTELDVLKGLDLHYYRVTFLILQNKLDDELLQETYLQSYRYQKIRRLGGKDCYVHLDYLHQKIHKEFEIVQATYFTHLREPARIGNATIAVKLLAHRYATSKQNNIVVSNALFGDPAPGRSKNIFIHVKHKKDTAIHTYVFAEASLLDFQFLFGNLKDFLVKRKQAMPASQVAVSVGEIVDKLSVLAIKRSKITDPAKSQDIQHEMDVLEPSVRKIQQSHGHLYNMLVYVNTLIWEETDRVKALLQHYEESNFEQVLQFARLSKNIFEQNQKRFRIKKRINDLYSSELKEHKSYAADGCFLDISCVDDIYRKIPEIHYLSISYDILYVDIQYESVLNRVFEEDAFVFVDAYSPTWNQEKSSWSGSLARYDLATYHPWDGFPGGRGGGGGKAVREVFELEPIRYLAGGRLGDFVNQLSVVCENYYATGKKGVVYITNEVGDPFVFSLEATHQDTHPLLSAQPYLKSYQIHQGEPTDVNLSAWRHNLVCNRNWCDIYQSVFHVEWGTHQWLTLNPEVAGEKEDWTNKIVINTTSYRFPTPAAMAHLKAILEHDLPNCVFVSNEEEHFRHFFQKTRLWIRFYKPSSFTDMVQVLNNCKACYLGMSACGAIANALHKPHTVLGTDHDGDCKLNEMAGRLPHVLGMFR